MEENSYKSVEYCMACFSENASQIYKIENEDFKTILQENILRLCFICKSIARYAESFIDSVQRNQTLLDNLMKSARMTILTIEPRPIKNLEYVAMEAIDIGREVFEKEPFPIIIYSHSNEMMHTDSDIADNNEDISLFEIECESSIIKAEPFDTKAENHERVRDSMNSSIDGNSNLELDCESMEGNVDIEKTEEFSFIMRTSKECKSVVEEPEIIQVNISREDLMKEREQSANEHYYINSAFQCETCVKGFMFRDLYEKHLKLHCESNGKYECDVCKLRFPTQEKLSKHSRCHLVRYKCKVCNLTRKCRSYMKNHYEAAHSKKCNEYCCSECGRVFRTKETMKKHKYYTHTNKRVMCEYCKKVYVNKDTLRKHTLEKHPKEVSNGVVPPKKYICPKCGRGSESPASLKTHMLSHDKKKNFYCVECDKSFKTEVSLKQHLKITAAHAENKDLPLQCGHCDKRFGLKKSLERHILRIHLNLRPFHCNLCDKTYTQRSCLLVHKRFAHEGYSLPKKYACTVCDRAFNRTKILKIHMRTHTGERPLSCAECCAKFRQPGALYTHVQLVHRKEGKGKGRKKEGKGEEESGEDLDEGKK
ncbi:zinc finger protein 808-like [Zerene cesonia]|uniref:zinc finger protein 808-like n=1 Tax=Zerene cesonia TaxID=33412 RepID=UPI0018E55963|nr:zinc finger protein 808-like [Zerene cesonia]